MIVLAAAFVVALVLAALIVHALDYEDISFGLALLAVFAIMAAAITWESSHYHERTITCHVTDKDRGGNKGAYRVYTSDCGTLSNHDSLFRGKTDSADVWAKIKPGTTQRFHVAGWRLGLTSSFPNILSVEK